MDKKEKVARILCAADGLDWEWLKDQQRYRGVKDCEYYLSIADEILGQEDDQQVSGK